MNESDEFDTFLSSLSSCGVLVPLELLPLRLEFGVSRPSGVRLRGEGGEGSLDSEEDSVYQSRNSWVLVYFIILVLRCLVGRAHMDKTIHPHFPHTL